MSSVEKYFAPFNFDEIWSVLAVSIKATLQFDFVCVISIL